MTKITPDEFKAWRLRLELTQEQLAKRWSISRTTVVAYESGRSPIRGFILDAMKTLERGGDTPNISTPQTSERDSPV